MSAEFRRLCYNMNHKHRGHCVIFNQENFEFEMGRRTGACVSRDDLQSLFSSLGFIVKVHNDLTLNEIQDIIKDLAVNIDHTDCDALVIVFLSHVGLEILHAYDKPFPPDLLFRSFQGDKCKSLAGKPKIFFIEGNRGIERQNGITVPYRRGKKVHPDTLRENDPCSLDLEIEAKQNLRQQEIERSSKYEKHPFKISSHADFLVCWSTTRGSMSFRDPINGGLFSQALKHVLQRDCEHDDLLSMMTTVNHFLTTSFSSGLDIAQVSCTESTLTKKVYLTPKHEAPECRMSNDSLALMSAASHWSRTQGVKAGTLQKK